MPCCCRRRAAPSPGAPALDRFSTSLADSSPVSQVVLLILALLLDRFLEHHPLQVVDVPPLGSASPRSFLDVFRRSNKFSEVQAVCRSLGDSPLVGLFQAGYAELTAQLRQATPARRTPAPIHRALARRPTLKSLTAVDRALLRASVVEVNKLEQPHPVSGDDGEHRAVHRAVRHGRGAS